MEAAWQGPAKWVFVCGRHAAKWRRSLRYVYMEELTTGAAYPGQRCETPYERSHEHDDATRFAPHLAEVLEANGRDRVIAWP